MPRRRGQSAYRWGGNPVTCGTAPPRSSSARAHACGRGWGRASKWRRSPAVEDYHRRAGRKPVIDCGFQLIISDPTETALREELPALIREGYTSFKIYMTYETLKLSDRQIISVLALARHEGAMV